MDAIRKALRVHLAAIESGDDLQAHLTHLALHEAICSVVGENVTVVAAAGNSSQDAAVTAPAKYVEVIAVSSVTDLDGIAGGLVTDVGCSGGDDTFATYSNFGAVVDVAAPKRDVAEESVRDMCRKLLANPVTEDFEIASVEAL